MSELDLNEENRRLRNEVERLQVYLSLYSQLALRLQCMRLNSKTDLYGRGNVSPSTTLKTRSERSPIKSSAPRITINNYDTNHSSRGVGSFGLRSYTSQAKINRLDTNEDHNMSISQYSTISRDGESRCNSVRRNYLARKYSELRAQDLPLSHNTSFQMSTHSREGPRPMTHLRENSSDSHFKKLELYQKKRQRPVAHMSAANLLANTIHFDSQNSERESSLPRNFSATRIPSMRFRDNFNNSCRLSHSVFSEKESTISRKARAVLRVQKQEERQRERYKKIEQMPLVKELERSLKESERNSRDSSSKEQESFISFRPTSVERPLDKLKIDRERHSLYKEEIATIQKQIKRIDSYHKFSRQNSLTRLPLQGQTKEKSEKLGGTAVIQKRREKSVKFKDEPGSTAASQSQSNYPSSRASFSSRKYTRDDGFNSELNLSRESTYYAPRAPPPRPDSPPKQFIKEPEESIKLEKPQALCIKSGMTSWNVSPMTQHPQSMDNSLMLHGLKMPEEPVRDGLLKLYPTRKETSPSPPKARDMNKPRGVYAINLEPITSRSPEKGLDSVDDFQNVPMELEIEKSQFQGTVSMVCSGSPPKRFKTKNTGSPFEQKVQSKTSLLLQNKIGGSSRKKGRLDITINSPTDQNEMPSTVQNRFKSPAHRYDNFLTEHQDSPLKGSARVMQAQETLREASKDPTSIAPLDTNRSIGSPLRKFQKKVGILTSHDEVNSEPFAYEENKSSQKVYLELPQSSRDSQFANTMQLQEMSRDTADLKASPLRTVGAGKMGSMLRLNLCNQIGEIGDSLNFNSTHDSEYNEMYNRRADGIGSEERREKEIEKIRRAEALSKRRGSHQSPSKPRVSGGMARKPNAIIKKLKEQEMMKESANSSLRLSILSNKLNTSIVSRRGSNAQDLPCTLSPAAEMGGSGSHMTSFKSHKACTGTGARSVSKTPTTVRDSSTKKEPTLHKVHSQVSEFNRTRKPAPGRKGAQTAMSRQKSDYGMKESSLASQLESMRCGAKGKTSGKLPRSKKISQRLNKAESSLSFLQSPETSMTFREENSESRVIRGEHQDNSSRASTHRDTSMKFRKGGGGVSPFVLARTGRKKNDPKAQRKNVSPTPVVKEKQYCGNCVRLLSKGLSSAFCKLHEKPQESYK